MNAITYIVQSSTYRDGRWSAWTCVSPQYASLDAARRHYEDDLDCLYVPECIRLVRVTTRWEQIPGVRCAYNNGSRLHVYASKRLRCRSPICRPPKRKGVPK